VKKERDWINLAKSDKDGGIEENGEDWQEKGMERANFEMAICSHFVLKGNH